MRDVKERFKKFDRENPHVWEMFKRFAAEALSKGHKRLSSSLIVDRMRWETMMQTTDPQFKLNDNFTPYYARKFLAEFPVYDGFFCLRTLHS